MAEVGDAQKKQLAVAKQIVDKFSAESPEKLVERLDKHRQDLLDEVSGLSDAQLEFSPGEGQWSVKETCLHVSNSLNGTAGLSVLLASGEQPEQKGDVEMGVLDEAPADFESVKVAMGRSFDVMAQATENLREDCNLELVFAHPWFGELNCYEWVAFNLVHMGAHVRQVRRIKGTDGFPAN